MQGPELHTHGAVLTWIAASICCTAHQQLESHQQQYSWPEAAGSFKGGPEPGGSLAVAPVQAGAAEGNNM